MPAPCRLALVACALALTGFPARSTVPGTPGSMFIESCSLGCSDGSGGAQVSCGIGHIHVNEELRVRFSEPVDPSSLNAASFRVVDLGTGTIASAQILVDAADPQVAVFRPDLSFDAMGQPVFGLAANTDYLILIPGEAQGDSPPFIRSLAGADNQSRMQCPVTTDLGELPPLSTYCSTSPNSVGPGANIGYLGSSSLAANDLVLTLTGAPALQRGLFFLGRQAAEVPLGDGVRCVGGPFVRLYPSEVTDGSGAATRPLDLTLAPLAMEASVGTTLYFQFKYRDGASSGAGFNLSDGLEVLFYP